MMCWHRVGKAAVGPVRNKEVPEQPSSPSVNCDEQNTKSIYKEIPQKDSIMC